MFGSHPVQTKLRLGSRGANARRLSPAVVEARRALLEQCLQDAVHGGASLTLRSAPPLLAFLHPNGGASPSSEGSQWRSPLGAAPCDTVAPAAHAPQCRLCIHGSRAASSLVHAGFR